MPANLQVLLNHLLTNWSFDSTNISLQLGSKKTTFNLHLQVVFENLHPTFRLVCVTIVRPGKWLRLIFHLTLPRAVIYFALLPRCHSNGPCLVTWSLAHWTFLLTLATLCWHWAAHPGLCWWPEPVYPNHPSPQGPIIVIMRTGRRGVVFTKISTYIF